MSLLNRIMSTPKFKKEAYDHKWLCNGEGVVIEISCFYPFDSRERPCAYCARIEKVKQNKMKASKEQSDGNTEEHQRTPELSEDD